MTGRRVTFVREGWLGTTTHEHVLSERLQVQCDFGLVTSSLTLADREYTFFFREDSRILGEVIGDLIAGNYPEAVREEAAPNAHQRTERTEPESPYDRPWYDSNGAVTAATLLILPLGIWGLVKRRSMAKPGSSQIWHHTIPVWFAALIPYSAPLALYGFWRRSVDEDSPTGFSDYLGILLAFAMTVMLLGMLVSFIRYM